MNLKKVCLSIVNKTGQLSLLISSDDQVVKYHNVITTSIPEEEIVGSVRSFVAKTSWDESIVVIPRSDVLQKELLFDSNEDIHQSLNAKISQLLPYSIDEIAYSLVMKQSNSNSEVREGILYAVPEKKLDWIIKILDKAHIAIDELVSEDQPIQWLMQDQITGGPCVLVDEASERTLVCVVDGENLLYSQFYPSGQDMGMIKDSLPKIYMDCPIKHTSQIVLTHAGVSRVQQGVQLWPQRRTISLLPQSQRVVKLERTQKREFKQAVRSMACFILSISLLLTGHVQFLNLKEAQLEESRRQIAPSILDVKRMKSSLENMAHSIESKERLAMLLKTLATDLPRAVQIKSLKLDDRRLVLKGESPSNESLTRVVQVFEDIAWIKSPNLEHARLRKRLNQEFFEFEIEAKCLI